MGIPVTVTRKGPKEGRGVRERGKGERGEGGKGGGGWGGDGRMVALVGGGERREGRGGEMKDNIMRQERAIFPKFGDILSIYTVFFQTENSGSFRTNLSSLLEQGKKDVD